MPSMKNVKPTKLLWVDLEMTGLEPEDKRIIEVAAIVTDFDFNEIETYEAVIHQPESVLERADPWVKEHLSANGLFEQVRASHLSEDEVQTELIKLVKRHYKDELAILAGSSIHQDKRFIRRYWPELDKLLHYRMLDVTTLKIYAMGKQGTFLRKPDSHRALDDIRASISEFKAYLDLLKQ